MWKRWEDARTRVAAAMVWCAASAACGAGTPLCTPGATQACACPGGARGVQVCTDDGLRLGACRCDDAGVPSGDGSPACAPPRQMCGTTCVDLATDQTNCGRCGATCSASQPCVAGACLGGRPCPGFYERYCGSRCVSVDTDVANCGGCGTACRTGEACIAGRCQVPPTRCQTCGPGGTCGAGERCARRNCDGRFACFGAGADSTCDTVDGATCPRVAIYNYCTSADDCGPLARCQLPVSGSARTVCAPACTVSADCPASPAGSTALPVCGTTGCWLGCRVGRDTCPGGMRCVPFPADPTLGYCN